MTGSAPTVRLHLDGRIFGLQSHGGISRVFRELLAAWAVQPGVEVNLVLPPGARPLAAALPATRTRIGPSSPGLRPARLFGPLNRAWERRLAGRFWSSAEDGVYLSSFYSTHDALRIPQLFVLQDMIYERFPALFPAGKARAHVEEKARCAAAAAAILTPSAHALADARHFYGLSGLPSRVVPYAVSPAFLREPDPAAVAAARARHAGGGEYLLFAGARGGHKNFAGLLAAYRAWRQRDHFLLLAVGGGPAEPHDAALVESFALGDRVRFVAQVPEEELVTLFHGARAIVVPSLSEGYGFPVIEGLAAGRPVASSTGGSLPEVGGDVALYFDPRDPSSMLEAIGMAVDTPAGDPRLDRGRRLAASRTWAHVARDFTDFIQEISPP